MIAGAVDRLNLDGDDAAFDLVPELEAAFGISFARKLDWIVAGDVLQAVEEQLPPSAETGWCATSMTFFRMRRAVRERQGFSPVPRTPLTEVLGSRPAGPAKDLSLASGLRIAGPNMTWWGGVGCLALCVAFLGVVFGYVSGASWLVPVSLAVIGLVFLITDRRGYAAVSFGDWVKSIAKQNAGALMRSGADRRSSTIWAIVAAALSDYSGVPANRIGQETALWPQEKRRAA